MYVYVLYKIMKTRCSPKYHHNSCVITLASGLYSLGLHVVPMNQTVLMKNSTVVRAMWLVNWSHSTKESYCALSYEFDSLKLKPEFTLTIILYPLCSCIKQLSVVTVKSKVSTEPSPVSYVKIINSSKLAKL